MLSLLYHAFLAARRLFDVSAKLTQDRDDRYLSESADIYDLERRMRQIDSGQSSHYGLGATGIFTR